MQQSLSRTRSPIFGHSQIQTQPQQNLPNDIVTSNQPPTKINPNFTFTAHQIPYVRCHYHPDQQIRNFCLSPTCLMPLCPACVAIHQHEHEASHTAGRFETLENCLSSTYQDVANECNKFVDDLYDVSRLLGEIKNQRQIHQQQIQESKQKLHQVIDAFFEALDQEQLRQNSVNSDQLYLEAQKTQQAITTRWETLVKMLEKLNTDKCLKSLIKYYSKEIQDQCAQYHSETRINIQQHRDQLPTIVFDQSVLYQINQSLQKLIKWSNQVTPQLPPPIIPQAQSTNFSKTLPQPIKQAQVTQMAPLQMQNPNIPSVHSAANQIQPSVHQNPMQQIQAYQQNKPGQRQFNYSPIPHQQVYKPQQLTISGQKGYQPVNIPGQVITFSNNQNVPYYYPQGAVPTQYPQNPFLQNMPRHALSPGSPSPRLDLSFSPQLEI